MITFQIGATPRFTLRPAGLGKRKIKVTYIAGSLGDGGCERLVLDLLRHLDRTLFEPSLILMEDVNLERAKEWVSDSFVMGVPQGGNARWISRSFSLISAVRNTRARLTAWDSDIVHAFSAGPSILGALAARLAHIPVIIGSRHALLSLYRPENSSVALADRIAFHLAHLNLAPSAAVTEQMVRLGGCPPGKVRTLYNGVDTSRFRADSAPSWRASLGWSEDQVIIGMVGNFRPCKRHADFIRAAAILAESHPEARFLMAGADHGTRPAVERAVEALGLEAKVRILEAARFPEKILAGIDICVCTSSSEGFSLVLAEAMSCGKPVVATSVGGIPEVVKHGETGFLVPPCSPQAVAEAVEKLLRDPALRRSMGECGRKRVEQEFSLDRMVSKHQQLYCDLLRKSSAIQPTNGCPWTRW